MPAGASADAGSFRRTVVYLVRHGQTPLNESGVLRGLADPPLDETGRRQAQRLGAVLGPRGLAAVFSSPLVRARQTAQPAAERAGLDVAVDQCLLDRDYGPWTGISRESVTDRSRKATGATTRWNGAAGAGLSWTSTRYPARSCPRRKACSRTRKIGRQLPDDSNGHGIDTGPRDLQRRGSAGSGGAAEVAGRQT
jgi:hypothetical protein